MASIAAVIVGIMGVEHRALSALSGHIRIKVVVAKEICAHVLVYVKTFKILAFRYFYLCFCTLLGATIVWQAWRPSLLDKEGLSM